MGITDNCSCIMYGLYECNARTSPRPTKKGIKDKKMWGRRGKLNYKLIMGHDACFKCANGFHTYLSASPVIVFVFGLDLTASLPDFAFSFLPSPLELPPPPPFLLSPCTRPSTPSASSAAALSSPRSARPSRRRAARATRYRVLARAGAGVRLGRLCVGEEYNGDERDWEEPPGRCVRDGGSESDAALLALPLPLAE